MAGSEGFEPVVLTRADIPGGLALSGGAGGRTTMPISSSGVIVTYGSG